MANVEHEDRDKNASTGGAGRFVLLAAATVILALAVVWVVMAFTGADPMAAGGNVTSEPDPAIVIDPAMGTEAPLSSDTQGATRVELGSTPPDTTAD